MDLYCVRRVNPFLGVVAVVKTPDGRALSVDGRHWQLQILAQPPRGLWSGAGYRDELQYFRFGLWSERDGLTRVPLNPILDVGRMLAAAGVLIDRLGASLPALPFPLAPELELWLLDQAQAPLALLAAVTQDAGLDEVGHPAWSAGGRGERTFVSATLLRQGGPARAGSGRAHHAEAVERLVQATAGRRLNDQWFRRAEDGSGIALERPAPEGPASRRLPPDSFPPLPLRSDWPVEADRALVADYLDWLAPYLLTLPGIDADLRRRLERAAVKEALLVDALWRLYPQVQDEGFLTRARVEASLRRANA